MVFRGDEREIGEFLLGVLSPDGDLKTPGVNPVRQSPSQKVPTFRELDEVLQTLPRGELGLGRQEASLSKKDLALFQVGPIKQLLM